MQTTRYPWEGNVKIAVDPAAPSEFTLHVRIPGWSQQSSVRVNGAEQPGVQAGAYLPIRRRWSAGDVVELSFDMSTRLLRANPAVNEDRGRIAFQRGPIVFCMEMLDQPDEARAAEIVGYTAHLDASTTPRYAPDLLDGVMVLEHPGSVAKGAADTSLYFTAGNDQKVAESPATLRLIPYYAWANRAPSSMQVWIPYRVG
jgi:hypothetical protein